ncbi:MAG: hypothetical protein EAZ97_07390 [Bacteroidetes bacterium]|nr:MAG: hypothetical protein EAZ97_07390 [Bacteroidota bacterium]
MRENLFFVEISQINKDLANKFAFILNGVKKEEIAIALKINGLEKRLNELIDSQKGANLQALVHAKGDKYVLGWKNIDRYQFASNLQSKVKTSLVHDTKALVKNNAILVQNMISFINAPKAGVQISACLALKQDFFVLDSINQLKNKSDYDTKFVLAIINSKLVSWYIYHFILAHDKKVVYFDLSIIEKIPFPNLDLNDPNDKNKYDSMIEKVENLSKWYKQKNKFAAEISRTEPELDKLVFDLYGLNEEEIKFLK